VSSLRPRICILCESLDPPSGRLAIQARALASGLAGKDVPTVAVTLRSRPDEPALEQAEGFEVHRVAAGGARFGALGPVLRKLDELRGHYDLIYVPRFHRLGVAAVLIGRARGKRVVLKADDKGEISGVPPGSAPLPPAFPAAAAGERAEWSFTEPSIWTTPLHPVEFSRRALLRRADHFVATAPALEQELVSEGVPSNRVTVIPNGVDVTRFRPAQAEGQARLRERLGLPERATVVCFSGRMLAWKGPLVLIEAWREMLDVRSRNEESLRGPQGLLLFLGSGAGHPQSCEEQARRFRNENGLEGRVRFLGDVRNVDDYLRAADAFALPTWGDAFALALAEAMACGLAAVTTSVCAEGNRVVHDENGLVVPPGDVAALRDALVRLLDDPGLRGKLGEAAAHSAREFSMDETLERHVELFRRLTESPRS
jgi:glycosyltransferase involved in cell wall biosynthesis